MKRIAVLIAVTLCLCSPLGAQDVRGVEVCTVEKDLNRRTSCLQSNVQFLQAALDKATRDAQDKIAAASREIVAQKTELAAQKNDIAALKDTLTKMQAQLDAVKKAQLAK